MASVSKPSVFVIELNEFNETLLQTAVKTHDLPALKKILNMKCSHYRTQDRYNSGYLEPWVQWLSIHTSTPASTHRIKHLGDVPESQSKQCWETLSDHKITTGVWGLMNAERRNSPHNHFFLPDPWTFSEKAYPPSLNRFLALPRYLAKNYLGLNLLKVMAKGCQFLQGVWSYRLLKPTLKALPSLLKAKWRFGKKHCTFIAFFDYLSGLALLDFKKRTQPQVTFAFFNALAHAQHHYWTEGETTITPEILYTLQYLDKLFGIYFESFPNDRFVFHNGLSQMNTNHEKPWVLYRQKDPKGFLRAMQLPFIRVEPHMTHDAHVFFLNKEACIQSYQLLKQAQLGTQYLFDVELSKSDSCKLFYQLRFTDALAKTENPTFELNQKCYAFFDYFDAIVTRTGRHIPLGTIYSDTVNFPDQILNHEFNQHLFHYCDPDKFPLTVPENVFADILEMNEE